MDWLTDKLTRTPEDRRLLQQERSIMEVTELISRLMDAEDVSKAELARRLGTSNANITQLLDGRRNMTLATISDALLALNHALRVSATRILGEGEGSLCQSSVWSPRAPEEWTLRTKSPSEVGGLVCEDTPSSPFLKIAG